MKWFAQLSFSSHVVAKYIKNKNKKCKCKFPVFFLKTFFNFSNEQIRDWESMEAFSMATCILIILAEDFVCLLIKGLTVPVHVLKCCPWEGHARSQQLDVCVEGYKTTWC